MAHEADYHALRLPPGAAPGDVRQAYVSLVMVWNPTQFAEDDELHGIAVQRTGEIRRAYRNLCDATDPDALARRAAIASVLTASGFVNAALWGALLVAVAYFGA